MRAVSITSIAAATLLILAARLAVEEEARTERDLEVDAAVAHNRFATGLSP